MHYINILVIFHLFHIQRTKYTIIKGIYIAPIYIKIHPINVSNNIITAEVFEERYKIVLQSLTVGFAFRIIDINSLSIIVITANIKLPEKFRYAVILRGFCALDFLIATTKVLNNHQ